MNDSNNKREKFLEDREFPTSQEVQSYKNFDQVMKSHALAKSILVKKIIIWSCVALVASTAAVVGYFSLSGSELSNTTSEIVKEQNAISPPLPGKEVQFTKYVISAAAGGEILHNNTVIKIPANAFLNSDGKIIKDSIILTYREYFNVLDIFLSGIPMNYDSAGTTYTFESAGMFEMLAHKGDEELILDANKPISVELPFTAQENYFNTYRLDSKTGEWKYLGKNIVKEREPSQTTTTTTVNTKNTTKDFTSATDEMLPPQKADNTKHRFNIDYKEKDFPELVSYKNIFFEVINNNDFPKIYHKITWDGISLSNSETKGIFIAALSKADTTIYVEVKPVFKEENYEAALKAFEEQQKINSKNSVLNEIENERKINKINSDIGADATRTGNAAREDYLLSVGKYSTVIVQQMGTYNCDFATPPLVLASNISLTNNFKGFNTTTNCIYAIEKGKNALFKYKADEKVRYNPGKENLAWTMNDKNEFLFIDQSELDKPDLSFNSSARLVAEEDALKRIQEFMN